MLCAALVKVGGVKPGTVAEIEASVPPELKPLTNALFDAVAMDCTSPATPGANGPEVTNVFLSGGFVSKLLATVPGKTSEKIPTPPRITVLPTPKGCQAKPTRGSQLML